MAKLLILLFITQPLVVLGQDSTYIFKTDKEYAKEQLIEALSDFTLYKVTGPGNLVLPTKESAIRVAEPILFSVYGKRHVKNERPYKSYFIDNYWIITGTMPKKYVFGGTFLIILDARDSKIIRITHGK